MSEVCLRTVVGCNMLGNTCFSIVLSYISVDQYRIQFAFTVSNPNATWRRIKISPRSISLTAVAGYVTGAGLWELDIRQFNAGSLANQPTSATLI
jgi:hypothetical protein